ncbi:aminopeptidase [Fusobacterium mortiferum]|uniref:aminopeptidase n=1 Tax=Fusobacterium mortiferum TaxID=850 RepID=UPI00195E7A0C|nr:aminopeptidase [uncultured Fusobacterium sp.]MBM6822390.1 aminopeptidase [Fusobacterium mortiferum]
MERQIDKYVELVIQKGINIQKGQILVISSPVEVYDFTRKLVKQAYELGASEVVVHWNDEVVGKYKYVYGAEDIFDTFPEWQKESMEYYRKKGAAFLSVYATDPDILKEVDKTRVARFQKAKSLALKEYYENVMGNSNQWCVISVPTQAWAKRVFPELSIEVAISEMWKLILKIVRADKENPILEWENHLNTLKARMDYLNKKRFAKLIYRNSLGTNLEIGLPEGHKWISGGEKSKAGVEFVANIPTEEIFTMPHREKVNGVVVSSKPLIYGGSVIDKFTLTFKDGEVINYSAEIGEEILGKLLSMDENSKYLGEVALVEYDSPISKSERVFYNTLFDENASCHLAFGGAYPVCLENSEGQSEEELKERGMNNSLTHEDFMIGTEDMEIVGIDSEGRETTIMKNGNFVFTL